jgi:hypothetical protein
MQKYCHWSCCFAPLQALQRHVVLLEDLFELSDNFDAPLNNGRVRVMYFYFWGDTAKYEPAKSEEWVFAAMPRV